MSETAPADGLGARIRSGVAWKTGSQLVLQVSRMVVALVLARLLAPEDWGLAAMVLVFSGFVVVFTDNALGTALIQRARIAEADRSTVFWISAGIGLALMLVGFAAAQPLASFYGEPEVSALFAALSVGFFVSALGTTHMALLAREMQFRRLEIRQMAATLVGAVLGIGLALADYGAWAFVGQALGEAVTSTALLWVLTPWRPRATFSVASLRRLGTFAGNVFGENVLYQAGRNISSLLIGRVLGAASLGTYTLATNVILMPLSRLAGPLQQVFFPAFSRMSGDRERLADTWIRASRLIGALVIPALVGLVAVAPDFVTVVLGERWDDATPVIQVLAWVGLVQALQTLNGEVLLALDRSGTLFRFTLAWFLVSVGAVALGLQWGILGVAVAYTAASLALEPVRAYLATRALGIPVSRFLRAFSGVAQAAVLMAIVLVVARALLVGESVPASVRLAVLVPLGALAYVAACAWRAPELVGELRSVLRRRPRPAAVGGLEPV